MGGIGSGRGFQFNKQTTFEETRRVDIRYLKKRGFLRTGVSGTLHWKCGGEENGFIHFETYLTHLKLIFRAREYGGKWESITQNILLAKTRCNFGGYRQWLVCPNCQKRVIAICGHGKRFYCRTCYGLPYGSQRENRLDRLQRAKNKLGERIFDETGYTRRKGLHHKTYERLLTKYWELDEEIEHMIAFRLGAYIGLL